MLESLRIGVLQQRMLAAQIDAALFQYSRSTLYYAGTAQPSILVVTPDDYHIFVLRGVEAAVEESWLPHDRCTPGNGYGDVQGYLETKSVRKGRLGIEMDVVSASSYRQLTAEFSSFDIVDASDTVLAQRTCKDGPEVGHIKEACRILDQGHQRLVGVLREGMTELELSSEIEDAHRRAGHEGLYFMRQLDFFMGRGPLASGENLSRIAGKVRTVSGVGLSASIPMGASRRKIQKGDAIVVDIPTHCHGYHCDQSRTYSLGKPLPGFPAMYDKMKEIADRTIELMRPGVTCGAIYQRACSFAAELDVGRYFMRLGDDPKPVTFVGHGIGLELNEPPFLGRSNPAPLQEGMVVALELEMRGPAGEVVKLEDTILIRSTGAEILTITSRDFQIV